MEINIKFNESDIEKMKKLKYLDLNVNDEKELKKMIQFYLFTINNLFMINENKEK